MRPFVALFAIGLMLAFALFAYRVGRSQAMTEIVLMEREIDGLHDRIGALAADVASAEQREAEAVARRESIERAYGRNVPRGDLRELTKLVQQRLEQGLPADRLAFLIANAAEESRCSARLQRASIAPRTPMSTGALEAATFADGKINVTAQGAAFEEDDAHAPPEADAAPGEDAVATEPPFDPSKPVELRFMRLTGEIEIVRETLPAVHAVVVEDREYRFAAVTSTERGRVDLTIQDCEFP